MQVVAPAGEYVPGEHNVSVVPLHWYPAGHKREPDPDPLVEVLPYGSIEPAGHVYPEAHAAVHVAAVSAVVEPYLPALHGRHVDSDDAPVEAEYVPWGQAVGPVPPGQ